MSSYTHYSSAFIVHPSSSTNSPIEVGGEGEGGVVIVTAIHLAIVQRALSTSVSTSSERIQVVSYTCVPQH